MLELRVCKRSTDVQTLLVSCLHAHPTHSYRATNSASYTDEQAKQAAAQSPYGPGAISFEFAQVGKVNLQ